MKLKLLKLLLIGVFCGACSTNVDNQSKNIIVDSLEKKLPSIETKVDTSKEEVPKYTPPNKKYQASLDTLKKLSKTLKIKSKTLQESIPDYITSFTIQNAIQANSEEATKYIMAIFLKQLLFHLKCCHQSYQYEIRSKKVTASKVMIDYYFSEEVALFYLQKKFAAKFEAASSWQPYFWILETNFAKDDEIIQQLLIDIQKTKNKIDLEFEQRLSTH